MSEKKVGLVFGSDSGNTEDVAKKIKDGMAGHGYEVDVFDIQNPQPEEYLNYDFLIMGIPTWDYGGIQQDWEDFENDLAEMDFSNKVIALYGLGDQFGYTEWYLDAMGWLHDHLVKRGAKMIGYWSTEGYEFEESKAAIEDKKRFCGLALDEDCQRELTDERIAKWLQQIVEEYSKIEEKAA